MEKFTKIFVILSFIGICIVLLVIAYYRANTTEIPHVTIPTKPAITDTQHPVPIKHIFVIVMENKDYDDIIGNASAPYINGLAQTYGLATNYYGITHPSLPNYIALVSGNTQGITSDCTNCFITATNLADTLESHSLSWKAYMEDMPSPCFIGNAGNYAQKHNPFIYFNDIRLNPTRCQQHIVPLSTLAADIQAQQVPNFAIISPNLCNDMHNCSVHTGDTWLASFIPKITSIDNFTDSIIFITWDEGNGIIGPDGGHIPTIILSPISKTTYTSSAKENHYSLLRTIEDIWHLPYLGQSGIVAPMNEYFTQNL